MRKQSLFVKLFLSAMVFFVPIGVNAQVTIGSNNPPSPWSLLYLDAREQQRALHNARLTTDQRNALVTPDSAQIVQDLSMGLLLFNIDIQCLEFWNGSQWISLCDGDTPRPVFPDDLPTDENITLTAWTRVMYDFQRQTLLTVGGNDNFDSFQWQVSADNSRWFSIRGETGTAFNIPVDFMYDVDGIRELVWAKGSFPQDPDKVENTRELYFRRVQTVSEDTIATEPFNMLFIRTNTSGFSQETDINLRSLALNRASDAFGSGNTIRMTLLNVGATVDNSLGSLFQWGRTADDHQIINWRKGSPGNPGVVGNGTANIFDPATTHLNRAARPTVNATNFDMTTGQSLSDFRFFTSNHWSINANNLWGDGSTVRPGTGWTFGHANAPNNNNPCPAGWRVPTRWEFMDIHSGTGSGDIVQNTAWTTPANADTHNNHWRRLAPYNGAAGGAIITNEHGEALFLPAVGNRGVPGALSTTGYLGRYWSSTAQSFNFSLSLYFNAYNVQTGTNQPSIGASVRCVAE